MALQCRSPRSSPRSSMGLPKPSRHTTCSRPRSSRQSRLRANSSREGAIVAWALAPRVDGSAYWRLRMYGPPGELTDALALEVLGRYGVVPQPVIDVDALAIAMGVTAVHRRPLLEEGR